MKNIKIIILILTVIVSAGIKTVFASPAGDNIIISEVEYDTTGTEPGSEWFELYNPTGSSIDISGWKITDGEGTLTIPANTSIASGTYFLAANTTTTFNAIYSGINVNLEYGPIDVGSIALANGGDELTLSNGGTVIDFVSWENHTAGWNITANAGESIARINSTDTDMVADWGEHQSPTPGSGTLTTINNSPSNITLSTQNINENTATGTNIGTLTTTDVDPGDIHTYTLVAGAGDEDNALFQIGSGADANKLQLNFTPDFEIPTDLGDTVGNNTYSVRLQTNDGNGGVYQKSFIITVNDRDENIPVITLSGSPTVTIHVGDSYVDAGATASDDVDGDITANIIIVNPVDVNTASTYIISYNVADNAGNTAAQVIRTVNVEEVVSHRKKSSRRISKERLAEIFGKKTEKTIEDKKERGHLCESSILLHQNMKTGDRDGKYSNWEKGMITEVKLLQTHMNRLGFNAGFVDGILGPKTDAAIKRMQISLGFTGKFVDGYVGVLTRERINNSC